jgi:DNA-binding PadR family transcriptional regulator
MAQGKRLEADELRSDLIQLTALREAIEGDFYGSRMIADFANRGYIVSPGTIYPMLHVLERKGYWCLVASWAAIAGYTKRQKSVGAS